jgi:hypothetical protein
MLSSFTQLHCNHFLTNHGGVCGDAKLAWEVQRLVATHNATDNKTENLRVMYEEEGARVLLTAWPFH